ncbi:hypothetical protein BV898_04933 [Hypsibius exemplaris]|uniref:Uncharacterized protein n=1 Tax=Hypsibius exemplaris TaxID=2072580 RepID=A0A1W0X154_HYPEX|nr:hypothetical protein BV898_04933 [Hypsibius exemplaris]
MVAHRPSASVFQYHVAILDGEFAATAAGLSRDLAVGHSRVRFHRLPVHPLQQVLGVLILHAALLKIGLKQVNMQIEETIENEHYSMRDLERAATLEEGGRDIARLVWRAERSVRVSANIQGLNDLVESDAMANNSQTTKEGFIKAVEALVRLETSNRAYACLFHGGDLLYVTRASLTGTCTLILSLLIVANELLTQSRDSSTVSESCKANQTTG